MGGMGFKEIEGFNQALLAKQAWRLLNEPESLLSKVFCGHYYANKPFLDSTKGYRPSYAWRSILFGKELLCKGLGKVIGDGASTHVWLDKWILQNEPRRPISASSLYDIELRVCDLITENGSWNMEKLKELFPETEVKYISSIQLGNVADRYIWVHTKQGAYSVKSGYKLWSALPTTSSSIDEEKVRLKRRIWKLQAPPKVKIFWWRAVSGALAVAERLRTRGINIDERCKICQQETESISHVLFRCGIAKDILSSANIPSPSSGFGSSVNENIEFLLQCAENTTVAPVIRMSIPWSLWIIWKNRNNIVLGNTLEAVQVVSNRIIEEAKAWHATNDNNDPDEERGQSMGFRGLRWLPPAQGMVKCNVHAHWRSAQYHSGVAWIARDFEGQVLFHARDAIINSSSQLVAELRCILMAMQALLDLRIQDVIIASECRMAIEALASPSSWPRFAAVISQVLELKQSFHSCTFEEESTLGNSISRDIARSVNRYGRFQSYLAMDGPAWLHDRLRSEAL